MAIKVSVQRPQPFKGYAGKDEQGKAIYKTETQMVTVEVEVGTTADIADAYVRAVTAIEDGSKLLIQKIMNRGSSSSPRSVDSNVPF